jgi:hypothetical protein
MYRMANPASNFANLASITPSFLSYVTPLVGGTVQNRLQTFLTDPNETTYNSMTLAVRSAQVALATGDNASLRSLVAAADGRVAWDSTKTNTWTNYRNADGAPGVGSAIGENHNTRPEIMLAVLSSSGVGLSDRFSTTTSGSQKYQATRLGDSTNSNLGTFRLSFNN